MSETTENCVSVQQAVQLYRSGQQDASYQMLQSILKEGDTIQVLLWLARITQDVDEASAATELAVRLEPDNEVAQRAYLQTHRLSTDGKKKEGKQRDHLALSILETTGMTLRQSRSVLWPFRGVQRPIGEILDDGTIGSRDLAWAAENAYDEQVKRAATTLLLSRLLTVQERPLTPPLVITKDRYTERQERFAWMLSGLSAGVSLAIAVIYLIVLLSGLVTGWYPPIWATGLFVVLFLIISRVSDRYLDNANRFRYGRLAEEQAVEVLRQALTGEWAIYRNLSIPHHISGDVDIVVVGPGGIWAVEVKSYKGEYQVQGKQWRKKGKRGWYTLKKDPGMQARKVATELQQYLKQKHVPIQWVQPVVLWSNSNEGQIELVDPFTPVWLVDDLVAQVDALYRQQSLTPELVHQTKEVLNVVAIGDSEISNEVKPLPAA